MSSPCNNPFISVSGTYKYYAAAPPQNIQPKQAGGLRIKSISSYNYNNDLVLKKSYEYGSQKMGSNYVGVGKLFFNPYELENYYKTLALMHDPTDQAACHYIHGESRWINANPMIELGYNNGNPVFYDKITEYIEDKNDTTKSLGKTEYFYSSQGVEFLPSADSYRTYNTFIYLFIRHGKKEIF